MNNTIIERLSAMLNALVEEEVNKRVEELKKAQPDTSNIKDALNEILCDVEDAKDQAQECESDCYEAKEGSLYDAYSNIEYAEDKATETKETLENVAEALSNLIDSLEPEPTSEELTTEESEEE